MGDSWTNAAAWPQATIGQPTTVTTTPWYPSLPSHEQALELQLQQAHAKIRELLARMKPLTDDRLNNIDDAAMILELIARGYMVSKMLADE